MVLRTENPRWWLAVGAAVGMGILSKYASRFPCVSLIAGLAILPSQRHHLRSRWFWFAAALALLIAAPHLAVGGAAGDSSPCRWSGSSMRAMWAKAAPRATGPSTEVHGAGVADCPGRAVVAAAQRAVSLLAFFYLGPLILFALAKGRGYYLLAGYVALYRGGRRVVGGVFEPEIASGTRRPNLDSADPRAAARCRRLHARVSAGGARRVEAFSSGRSSSAAIWPTRSGGRSWWRTWLPCETSFPRRIAAARRFSPAIMARQVRWRSMARSMGCRIRSAR